MNYRSWLLVPADSETKLAKASSTGADVVVIDLAGDISWDAKPAARERAAQWLTAHRRQIVEQRDIGRWVRISPLDSRMWRDDLVAVMASSPDGIILPRAAGPEAVRQLAAEIYELEQRHQIPNGATRVMPVAGETAASALTVGAYLETPHQRLAGLGWAMADLATGIGATRVREGKSALTDTFRFVRTQVLLAAHAIGLAPVEAFHAEIADMKGLKLAAKNARADGFAGMLALHPAQVPVINDAFTPSEQDVAEARALVEVANGKSDAGSLRIDRRMVETPNIRKAQRVLALDPAAMSAESARPAVLRPA